MLKSLALAASSALVLSLPALAETPQAAADRLDAFLDRFEGLDPGYAVVIVTPDEIVMNRATGVRNITTGAPMTPDTPMYIASQTKAYMGLLAAVLDERGILSLDSTIAEHWPGIVMPEGVDPAEWTMRDLLSHQVPITVDEIVELEAYVTRVEPADYPALIERYAQIRDVGFDYGNLGYNIYGAILETVTGRMWQDWLADEIFAPLALNRTSARTSDYAPAELAWNHTWLAEDEAWLDVAPKTDAMMQSAGGMMTTPLDMAQWLQIQLRGEAPNGSGISDSALATALAPAAATHQEDGRNAYEQSCSHYSLGWNLCEMNGNALYIHGGGYTGARSMMAFSPDLGIGIAAFSNSDNMTGWVVSRTIDMYLQFLTDDPEADVREQQRPDFYPRQVERLQNYIANRTAEARADEAWGGWSWSPTEDDLSDFVGAFETDVSYFNAEFGVRDGVLNMWMGDHHLVLEPAQADLFGARNVPYDVPEAVRFTRDANGRVIGFDFRGHEFARAE